mgnify:CR=1 FL=1
MNDATLVKMANQIAAALSANAAPDQAAQEVADHLVRFWAPPLRAGLINRAAGDAGLDPRVREAVARLRAQKQAQAQAGA